MKCHHTIMRVFLALLLTGATLFAVEVRDKPADYPVSGHVTDMKVGVEYLVRTFMDRGETFTIDDYLIVEVGVFPNKEANLDHRRFTLRVNGKLILTPEAPSAVAASVKYSDWRNKPSILANAGPVIIGRDPQQPRFPGDTRPPNSTPQQNPEKLPVKYDEIIPNAGLLAGDVNRPVAGLLFFPYVKKLKTIQSVELVIDDTALKLR